MDFDHMTVASSVARRFAREWPGVDRDDIESEAVLALTENAEYLKGLDDEARPKTAALIARLAANKYCVSESYNYRQRNAEWIYTPREVRALFEDAYFEIDAWLDAPRKDMGLSVFGGGICVALWDIRVAYEQLNELDQAVIMRAFKMHETLNDSNRKRLQRAIDRVTRTLNQKVEEREESRTNHDGPGSRRVMSNAAARAVTSNSYERG